MMFKTILDLGFVLMCGVKQGRMLPVSFFSFPCVPRLFFHPNLKCFF